MVALTEKQKAATERNRAAGVRARKAAKAEREARGVPLAGHYGRKDNGGAPVLSRAAQLEKGIINVHDLTDDELARKRCRASDGTFTGKPYPHSVKVLQAMDIELLRRGNDVIREGFVKATLALSRLLDHPEARVQIMAIDRIMERVAGKVPDKLIAADVTPHNEVGDEIASAVAAALGVQMDSITNVDGDLGDIVDAEIVEDEGPAASEPVRKTRRKG